MYDISQGSRLTKPLCRILYSGCEVIFRSNHTQADIQVIFRCHFTIILDGADLDDHSDHGQDSGDVYTCPKDIYPTTIVSTIPPKWYGSLVYFFFEYKCSPKTRVDLFYVRRPDLAIGSPSLRFLHRVLALFDIISLAALYTYTAFGVSHLF